MRDSVTHDNSTSDSTTNKIINQNRLTLTTHEFAEDSQQQKQQDRRQSRRNSSRIPDDSPRE